MPVCFYQAVQVDMEKNGGVLDVKVGFKDNLEGAAWKANRVGDTGVDWERCRKTGCSQSARRLSVDPHMAQSSSLLYASLPSDPRCRSYKLKAAISRDPACNNLKLHAGGPSSQTERGSAERAALLRRQCDYRWVDHLTSCSVVCVLSILKQTEKFNINLELCG